ncbi:hypothetical protein FRX31_009001 [Thalictrum thalictroides]|uniref:Uncharacterized protein n=1 Tax=Thalictrum thalictroides TaxID=46969 RepID=A0A7J6WVI1_THATH|nr:hypothetical protein FRX31_009001 [Thalictrum thalictroides]
MVLLCFTATKSHLLVGQAAIPVQLLVLERGHSIEFSVVTGRGRQKVPVMLCCAGCLDPPMES